MVSVVQSAELRPSVFVLVSTDPAWLGAGGPRGGVLLADGRIVTVQRDFDVMMRHMRSTYDPSGDYSGEGSGSWQNYKHLKGYRFVYRELPV